MKASSLVLTRPPSSSSPESSQQVEIHFERTSSLDRRSSDPQKMHALAIGCRLPRMRTNLCCSLVGAFGCSLESNSKHVVHLGDEVKGHLVSDRLRQVVKIGFVADREDHLAQT